MPVCFQLYRLPIRGDGSDTPCTFQQIDDEMRVHFNVPPSADSWLNGWYNTIGFRLAMGKTFDEIRQLDLKEIADARARNDASSVKFNEDELEIIAYLEARFTATSWRESRSAPREEGLKPSI